MMMPSPEYERWDRMSWDEYVQECAKLGITVGSPTGMAKEYRDNIAKIRELAIEGKGPGAWAERFHYECEKHDKEQSNGSAHPSNRDRRPARRRHG